MSELKHIGTPRHSGRYPWGSGGDPYQRNKNFIGYVNDLKKKGLREKEIAKGLDLSVNTLRAQLSIASNENYKSDYVRASELKAKGYSNTAIGKAMGRNESSIRSILNEDTYKRKTQLENTANLLKDKIENNRFIDVGVGTELHMGINRTKLDTAVSMLEEDGYKVHYLRVPQMGTDKMTSIKVLGAKDSKYKELMDNQDKLATIKEHSKDGGTSWLGVKKPNSLDSSKVLIAYDEDGGTAKDGLIEVRRGIPELSLGNKTYMQVRVAVDGTHYLKGMAIHADDLPPGVDVRFNTNKKRGTDKMDVLKQMKTRKDGSIDDDNPFGATIKQKEVITLDGAKDPKSVKMLELSNTGLSHKDIAKQLGVSKKTVDKNLALSSLNVVYEEGDWGKWSKSISSQVLSKQSPKLAEKQLKLAFDIKKAEYDEIMSLTDPVVQKKLLDSFADDCDSASVHLKAAHLPRQGTHVIIPIPNMKDNEVYAPNYTNGETVVLIRYPHGGTFEIPQLQVNNNHKTAKKMLGSARDAIGINSKVAEQLSGADFDGDSVLVIPNPGGKTLKSTSPLKALKDFDTKAYKLPKGKAAMTEDLKQKEMGKVSNLITDMTIKGATDSEIARAVKHSMVVIDAVKHELDYKQSAKDNGIPALKERYQGGKNKGASTLISRASSESRPLHRKEGVFVIDQKTGKKKKMYVDPDTGKKLYELTGESYEKVTKSGKVKKIDRTVKSTKMYEVDDAFELSSGTTMETVYATHANKLKALGNQSRKDSIIVKSRFTKADPTARKAYDAEVKSLDAKLRLAKSNAPLERQAQALANTYLKARKKENPGMDADTIKKIKGQSIAEARSRTGAGKTRIKITDREWMAISANAISPTKLSSILDNTDLDRVKELATPRANYKMNPAKERRAKMMLSNGHTQADIAEALGVSTSTINSLADE